MEKLTDDKIADTLNSLTNMGLVERVEGRFKATDKPICHEDPNTCGFLLISANLQLCKKEPTTLPWCMNREKVTEKGGRGLKKPKGRCDSIRWIKFPWEKAEWVESRANDEMRFMEGLEKELKEKPDPKLPSFGPVEQPKFTPVRPQRKVREGTL